MSDLHPHMVVIHMAFERWLAALRIEVRQKENFHSWFIIFTMIDKTVCFILRVIHLSHQVILKMYPNWNGHQSSALFLRLFSRLRCWIGGKAIRGFPVEPPTSFTLPNQTGAAFLIQRNEHPPSKLSSNNRLTMLLHFFASLLKLLPRKQNLCLCLIN